MHPYEQSHQLRGSAPRPRKPCKGLIKSGKITFKSSQQFRDMGALIESLPISEDEYTLLS